MPTATALLALALQTAPVPPAVAVETPATSPNAADERCIAAFAWLAGEPGQTGAAAQANRYGTLFFYGKLMGRDPGVDLGPALRGVAGEIAGRLPAEVARCRAELDAAGHAMAAAGTAARSAPGPSPPSSSAAPASPHTP